MGDGGMPGESVLFTVVHAGIGIKYTNALQYLDVRKVNSNLKAEKKQLL